MDWFPIFLNLRGANCLVVGGGAVARRKSGQLLAAGAHVTVAAPRLHRDLAQLAERGKIVHVARAFEPKLLDGCELVVAATDRHEVNQQVSIEARRRRLLVNVVDEPALCRFIMPAMIDRSPVLVAVSTSGRAPLLARRLKAQIEALLPRHLGTLAEAAGSLRETVKARVPDADARRRLWEQVFDGPIAERLDAGHAAHARQMLETLIDGSTESTPQGDVCLIGPAPEDPELLTLKALRLMQRCDVVLHDDLVSPEVLALARADAERIVIEKSRGAQRPLGEIADQIICLAFAGKRVLRLTAGRPLHEETDLLANADIPFRQLCHG